MFSRFSIGVYAPILIVAFLFLLPLLVVLGALFLPMGEHVSHIWNTVLPGYVLQSMLLVLGVALGSLFLGVSSAWFLTQYRFFGARFLSYALVLPLAVPAYIAAFVYAGLFEFAGPVQTSIREMFGLEKGQYWFFEIRSLGGAIFVMSVVFSAYVYLLARVAFDKSSHLVLVARSLGASGGWRLFRVLLPAVRPALVVGVGLVVMETLADYGTVSYFAVDTLTTGIYRSWYGYSDDVLALRLSAILLLLVVVVVVLERFLRGAASYDVRELHSGRVEKTSLKGWRACGVFLLCAVPFVFGFLLPVLQMFFWFVDSYEVVDYQVFFGSLLNTLYVAFLAALLVVVLAVVFAYVQRLKQDNLWTRGLVRFVTFGYAVPGSVVAVGVLVVLGVVDRYVNDLARTYFDASLGLLFSGTIMALLFAYAFRFLAVAFNVVESSFERVPKEVDWVAGLVGKGSYVTLWKVHVPHLAKVIEIAFFLVLVEVIKELPATLIIRPFNFDTLAIRAYELASDERLIEAGSYGLLIVVVAMFAVMQLAKQSFGPIDRRV